MGFTYLTLSEHFENTLLEIELDFTDQLNIFAIKGTYLQ